ncbi:MAG: DUF3530 family protein [Oleispira sp.]|nr:DUF3530 family protein [Oleispira sp.]
MKSQIQAILLLLISSISLITIAAEEESTAEETTNTEEVVNTEAADEPVAKTEQQPSLPRYLPNTSNKRALSLLDHMLLMGREDEVITLSNLAEEFYGLYLPQASGQPQGGILILHDEQQHGHWPNIIGPLREYLPQFGWSTLTIELPDQLKRQRLPRNIPTQTTSGDQASTEKPSNDSSETEGTVNSNPDLTQKETTIEEAKDSIGPTAIAAEDINNDIAEVSDNDNEPALPRLDKLPDLPEIETESPVLEEEIIDLIADYQDQNRQRIHTAIAYLQQQNQFNLVIIGFGRGASWAIDYTHQQIQQETEPKGLTLITIDALPNLYDKDLINQQLVDISLPYLDLLQSKKQFNDRSAAKRLSIMRRNNNPSYQQILTQAIGSYHELENPTNRRIRGWIKTHAGGTQIAIKP